VRYIKLYEEFGHDEIYDVMMSICDTVSFKESEVYPSTESIRVYETSEPVDFDPKQYEEYLEGWTIRRFIIAIGENNIAFIKGDYKEASISWLKEVYGNLKAPIPALEDGIICYRDDESKPLFYYYNTKYYGKSRYNTGYYYVNHKRIWSLFEYFGLKKDEIRKLISVWLRDIYNLSELAPDPDYHM
jgi:hypothetical protein